MFNEYDENLDNYLIVEKKLYGDNLPYIEKELLEHLLNKYKEELSFNKEVDYNTYLYMTGIVEVLQYIKAMYEQQQEQ